MSGTRYSVIVPLWNKEREVSRCLHSVLSQRCGDFDVVVVNDGSTDGSRGVVGKIADRRVRMVDQRNAGVSAARNVGVAHSTAPYVAFLDADDEWTPEFLERITQLVNRYPEASVFATGVLLDMGRGARHARVSGVRRDFCGLIENYFATRGLLSASSTVVRREAFETVGGFRSGVAFGEDMDLWLRLAARFPVAFDSRPSAVWHCGASSRACARIVTSTSIPVMRASLEEIERDSRVSPNVQRAARRYVADTGLVEIQRVLAHGNTKDARSWLREWRREFRPGLTFWGLMVASAVPAAVLRAAARLGARAKAVARHCADNIRAAQRRVGPSRT